MASERKTRATAPADPADVVPRVRRLPTQARGHAAFESILATAARLIEEGGIERLNTNLVAAEAGINISTVYKYFPNKLAILATLFERQSAERFAVGFDQLDRLPQAADWASVVELAIDQLVARRRSQPGHLALRRAMRSSPELTTLDVHAFHRAAERLATLLRKRAGLPRARSMVIARTLVELQVAMLDWWESEEGAHDPAIVRELKVMVKSYLAVHLGG